MSPTVLAGQNYDLQDSPENIVKNFIEDRWNHEVDGQIPAKSEITFSLFGWSGRKSYQISVEPSNAPLIQNMNIGGSNSYLKYTDPILLHIWIIKNKDEVPPQLHHMTQKIEQIVLENITNVGYGITAIRLIAPFSAIEETKGIFGGGGTLSNQTEVSLWHSTAVVELLYFKVTTGILAGARTSKTHKYNIQV
jgi:hypothetical protein